MNNIKLSALCRRLMACVLLPWICASAWAGEDELSPEDMMEVQKMMEGSSKELEEVLQGLDPETRRQLEELMPRSAAKPDREEDAKPAPAAIKVSSKPLSPQQLKAHVDALQAKLSKALHAEALKRAQSVEARMPRGADYASHLRAAANGLAAMGFWPEAAWLMGRLAQASGEVNDLNNLAAFLTTLGAAPAALPILYTLDARYPGNSTLLNNLGQALHAVGATDEAQTRLVAAVRITPNHPQANVTHAQILSKRGDRAGAQAALQRALEGGYSPAKMDALRASGGTWKPAKRPWHLPMPQDPLGLHKFLLPEFPEDPDSMIKVVSAWANFRDDMRDLHKKLVAQREAVYARTNDPAALMKATMAVPNMPFFFQAAESLNASDEVLAREEKRALEEVSQAIRQELDNHKTLRDTLDRLRAENEQRYHDDPAGEEAHSCDGVREAYEKYLKKSNPALQASQFRYLEAVRKRSNERAYMAQFIQPTADLFETIKVDIKLGYVQTLLNVKVAIDNLLPGAAPTCLLRNKPVKRSGALPDFDEIHCENVSEVEIKGLGGMKFRCNTAEAHFDPSFAPFEVAWKIKNTGKGDEMMLLAASAAVSIDAVKIGGHSEFDEKGVKSGGVSASVGADIGKLKGGPLEIGAEVGLSAALEFDRKGLRDVILSANMEGKASSTVAKTDQGGQMKSAVKSSVGTSWSWNSGPKGSVDSGFSSSVFNL